MKNNLKETFVALCLIALAALLLNPYDFWMPDMMVVGMLVVALVLFGTFAGFILREEEGDERDAQHRTLAGRNAFLVGVGVLTLAIAVGGYHHTVDPWLVVALIAMLITKIVTRIWSDRHL